jgi:hypothetical protein
MTTALNPADPIDYDEFYSWIYFTATKFTDVRLVEQLSLETTSVTYVLTILRVTDGELFIHTPEASLYNLPMDHPLVPLVDGLVGVTVPWAEVPFELQSVFTAPQ